MLTTVRLMANTTHVYRAYYLKDDNGDNRIVQFLADNQHEAMLYAKALRKNGLHSAPCQIVPRDIVPTINNTRTPRELTPIGLNNYQLRSLANILASTRGLGHYAIVNAIIAWTQSFRPRWDGQSFREIANQADDKYVTAKQASSRAMTERLAKLEAAGVDTSPRYPAVPGKPRNGLEAREARAAMLARSGDASEAPEATPTAPDVPSQPVPFSSDPGFAASLAEFNAKWEREHPVRPTLAQAFPHLTKK